MRILSSSRFRRGSGLAAVVAFTLLAPPSWGNGQTVLVPFRSVRSFILVEVKVNGSPATLLLDTGANNTIINIRMYGNAGAPRIEAVSKGPGIVGNALRLRTDLEIGGRVLFSQPVSAMNLDELARRFGIQFDGLLGQDILRQFRSVRINYRAHVIELEK